MSTAEEIYKQIGQTMVDSIESDWLEASLHIKRLDKFVSVKGYCKNYEGNKLDIKNTNFGYAFSKLIHELHYITTMGGQNKWNTLNFIIYPDGKFHLDFIWDQQYQEGIDNVK